MNRDLARLSAAAERVQADLRRTTSRSWEREAVGTLSVWYWSGRDRIALHDLEYLVAAPSRREWRQTVVRMRLPRWKDAGIIRAGDARFAVAAAAPGRVFWREAGEGTGWRDEHALEALRHTSTVRELSAGRYADPVHRSDPR